MKITAVLVVRNEELILPVTIAYHRAIGVDEFRILDNGSDDGTPGVLAEQEAIYGDLHWRSDPGDFRQSDMTSCLAYEATEAGADWIVPVDADEFWWTSSGSLHTSLRGREVGALTCEVDNFVQRRSVVEARPGELRTMTYCAQPRGAAADAKDLVETGKIGFVEMAYPPKLVAKSSPNLVLGPGNHSASGIAGPVEQPDDLRVLHAPIRSQSALFQRAEHGRRIAATNRSLTAGWHVRRWARLDEEGRLMEDWAANSQRRGRLDVYGSKTRLRRDLRLRTAVSPFVP